MEEQSFPTPRRRIPSKKEVECALGAFSPLERLVFIVAMAAALVTVLSILYKINDHFLVSVPGDGGTLNEGVVGTPRFVNPVLATTEADRDLSALVYRGLMKKDAEGNVVPDIAESYEVSDDGLIYTFVMKEATFQDGTNITSDDVLFTVKSVQDPTLKSALNVTWQGVIVKAVDEKTVSFTLKQPYASFLELTTLGIMPKHIWSKISYEDWTYSEFNTKSAIGAGLYRIKEISENANGVPQYYELEAYRPKNGPSPRIDTIRIHFYGSETDLIAAYRAGNIDAMGGIDPVSAEALAKTGAKVLTSPLPRVFGIFFNQSQTKIFTDVNVRKAVALAINRDSIVLSVLGGYGQPAIGPIPAASKLASLPEKQNTGADIEAAKKLLEKAGWKMGNDGIYQKQLSKKETVRLSFEIATNDIPELTQAVNLMTADLKEAGIEAIPKVYETGSLNQDIIRPRKFQTLFFGEVISTASHVYAFWHSSQRNDPGLNISGYANSKTDTLLERGLATLDPKKELEIYDAFQKEIAADVPAVFIYSPSYIYIIRDDMTGITIGSVTKPENRFAGIESWYMSTDRVWKIFAR
ncbi:MAG: hypothetical protein KA052_02940 [Candidatus Pacebacteria bacterium]|nr:hypothetical protein [Candidatus Paceibacterota bacterium]